MSKWFYTNEQGEKIEITGGQLKWLAQNGKITPETIIETEEGKSAPARKVKGLTFGEPVQSESTASELQPVPTATTTPSAYCTYCGLTVDPIAAACLACGADPRGHRKFCRSCGVPMNEVQVICTKCQTPVGGNMSLGSVSVGQIPVAVMQPIPSLHLSEHPLGKVLVSSNGQGSPSAYSAGIAGVFLAVSFMVAMFMMSSAAHMSAEVDERNIDYAKTDDEADALAGRADLYYGCGNLFFIGGLITPVIVIIFTVVVRRAIAKSEISVYENGVTGITGSLSPVVFQVVYDKITGIAVQNNRVFIQCSGILYHCHAANKLIADEIHRITAVQYEKHTGHGLNLLDAVQIQKNRLFRTGAVETHR